MLKEILANLFAGLGLFFIGVKFISEHMKQLAGRRVRRVVTRLTRHPALACVWGLAAGALIQSTTAVTFILTNQDLNPASQQALMRITSLFERLVWLLRQLGLLLSHKALN